MQVVTVKVKAQKKRRGTNSMHNTRWEMKPLKGKPNQPNPATHARFAPRTKE